MYRRCPSAKMVSNAKEDLPEPLRPVMTVRRLRGMETLIFFRLCTRAPITSMFESDFPILACKGTKKSWKLKAESRKKVIFSP